MEGYYYRPLIRLSKSQGTHVYLPLEHDYTLQQVAQIKKYIPKTLSFAGVDA